jgi:hypothetical protein
MDLDRPAFQIPFFGLQPDINDTKNLAQYAVVGVP